MKKTIITLAVIAAIAASVGGYYYTRPGPEPKVTTVVVTRGDITDGVGATGTLDAVTSVTVGSQVSGIIQELYADFNSIVRKGQVIARLDPTMIQTQIEQARANLVRAQADVERLKVTLEDAKVKRDRARELSGRKLITQQELETAEVNVKSAEAQLRSSQASLSQSEASLRTNEVNLEHTVIKAPIDGIVISRNVEIGQTVAASFNAPTLFIIAADLTKMKCTANIDESDVGRIRPGQAVTFRVDAYPTEEFAGTVSQVRLQPIVVQNVVTYGTVIDVPNPSLKLKPGMTANVQIEIARRTGVLKIPNSAARFRPSVEIFQALNQEVPPDLNQPRGSGPRMAGGAPGAGNIGAPTSGSVRLACWASRSRAISVTGTRPGASSRVCVRRNSARAIPGRLAMRCCSTGPRYAVSPLAAARRYTSAGSTRTSQSSSDVRNDVTINSMATTRLKLTRMAEMLMAACRGVACSWASPNACGMASRSRIRASSSVATWGNTNTDPSSNSAIAT